MGFWEYIKTEIAVLKGAPISFAGLVVVSVGAGIAIGAWHFGERLEIKEAEIRRYRVALGIDKGGSNALAELSNMELQKKSLNVAAKVRDLCSSFEKRSGQIKRYVEFVGFVAVRLR